MGTARILTLSLPNSHLFVGEDFSQHDQLNQLLSQQDVAHFVLYPGETSQEAQADLLRQQPKMRVILLDGTWKKAYKMWQLSSNLKPLPLLRLPTELKGNYRIRKAPSDNALSTVEAGFHILTLLEPERDFTPLLSAFDNMIQFQIEQMPQGVFEKNYPSK